MANGEIDVAFLNHYYLFRFLEEQGESFKARNYYFKEGDIGGLFLVAAAAVLNTSDHKDAAQEFIEFLLSPESQAYFNEETHEYPLIEGIEVDEKLQPLSEIQPPEIDLSDLTDLEGSIRLMRETGILP